MNFYSIRCGVSRLTPRSGHEKLRKLDSPLLIQSVKVYRRSWKSESEEKMIATLKSCAVAVYVTNAIVAASTGTEKAAAMLVMFSA